MSLRGAGLVICAAGLTLGTLVDVQPARARRTLQGRTVLTADLHVHAFPGDGMLPVWELRREAARRGVDVIAITNHNQSLAASLPVGADPGALPLVIPGQEITTPAFHLVAVGVRRTVDWRLPLPELIADVHGQGGAAIAAHPVKKSWRVAGVGALALLDGAEAVHLPGQRFSTGRRELREFYDKARARKPNLAAIGSSDFHAIAPLGTPLTYLLVEDVSERGIVEAIRRGRTVASDQQGTLIGDPELVRLVQDSTSGRATPPSMLASFAAALALAGLAIAVCLR